MLRDGRGGKYSMGCISPRNCCGSGGRPGCVKVGLVPLIHVCVQSQRLGVGLVHCCLEPEGGGAPKASVSGPHARHYCCLEPEEGGAPTVTVAGGYLIEPLLHVGAFQQFWKAHLFNCSDTYSACKSFHLDYKKGHIVDNDSQSHCPRSDQLD